MLSELEREAVDKGLVIMRVIWGVMLASVLIYGLICHLTGNQIRQQIDTDIPLILLKNILFGVALLTLIISYFVRKTVLTSRPSLTGLLHSNTPHLSTPSVFISKYTTAMIIALAFSESIAIYGVVLYFLGESQKTLYTFIGIAGIAMCFYRPKREEVETLVNEMKKNISNTPSL